MFSQIILEFSVLGGVVDCLVDMLVSVCKPEDEDWGEGWEGGWVRMEADLESVQEDV